MILHNSSLLFVNGQIDNVQALESICLCVVTMLRRPSAEWNSQFKPASLGISIQSSHLDIVGGEISYRL